VVVEVEESELFVVFSDELIGRFETTIRELTQGPGAANEYPVSPVLVLH